MRTKDYKEGIRRSPNRAILYFRSPLYIPALPPPVPPVVLRW